MSQFIIELAKETDDPGIRDLLSNIPMEGDIEMSFHRDPSVFYSLGVQGKFNQIVVARDTKRGRIVASQTRSIKPVYINGEVKNLGYTSYLRILPEYRRSTLLGRGLKYFKTLNEDGRVSVYVTSIFDSNEYAKKWMVSGKAGMPITYELGAYHTFSIIPFRRKKEIKTDLKVERGSRENLGGILECLARYGREKQFYPYYTREDFIPGATYSRDFNVEDFYIALKGDKIVGVIAKWDQNGYKQTVINRYNGKMRRLKPLVNFGSRLLGYPPMPEAGDYLRFFQVSFIAIMDNDVDVFRILLRRLYNDNIGGAHTTFLVGLHSKDPLIKALEEYHHFKYDSRIYLFGWEENRKDLDDVDSRIPYFEIGRL